jgi:methionyl-tRNA formyltransferase
MKIVYFGNGERGTKCLNALLDRNEDVLAVVGHTGGMSDFLIYAKENNIPVFQPENVNSSEFIHELKGLGADLFVLSGYNRILKSKIIAVPSRGCINLHGGKLPEYRGCAPINWQIINGEKIGGCCIIFVDEGIDTGDIICQKMYEILETDTGTDIVNKQLVLFPGMLKSVIDAFKSGTITIVAQDKEEGAHYTRRYPRDSLIEWGNMNAEYVCNLVRAMSDPYPNAFTTFNGRKVRIRKANRISPPVIGVPGRIPLKLADGIVVCCKDEGVLISEVGLDDDGTSCGPNEIFNIGSDFG